MDVKNLRGQQVRVELEDGSVRFVTVVTRARSGFWVVEGKTLPKRYARPDGTRRTTVHQNRITDADGRELFPPAADAVREDP